MNASECQKQTQTTGPDLLRRFTAYRAVRAKCLDCSGGQPSEVRLCTVLSCPLYPIRHGGRTSDEDLATFVPHCGSSISPVPLPKGQTTPVAELAELQ